MIDFSRRAATRPRRAGRAEFRTALAAALLLMLAGAHADQDAADAALTEILFAMDLEDVSYALRSDGFVDILFGPAVAQDTYLEAVARIRAHPAIPGVLAGRGSSDYCPLP